MDVDPSGQTDGTNVKQYMDYGSDAQKWRFIAWGGTTGQTVPDGSYHIVTALDSTKGLDVDNASKEDKANIQIFSNTADPTQTFSVEYLGNGYYKITSDNSGKSLDLDYDSTVCRLSG